MPVHLRASQLVGEKFFLPFIIGIYDNITVPGILKGSVTVVGLAQSLPDPDSYDSLDAPGLAQALERFFEVLTPTNMVYQHGLTSIFYRRLIGTWMAALRGYGAQSFRTYDARDSLVRECRC